MTNERDKDSASDHVLGIDGGGTASRALVVATDGSVLAELDGGPLNFYTTSPARFRESLEGLLEATGKLGLRGRLLHTAIGTAAFLGTASEKERRTVATVLENTLRGPLTVTGDAVTAAFGATGGGPGVLIIAGTGSIAVGVAPDGRHAFRGGFGPLIGGDPGSAFWMASEAVLEALHHERPGAPPSRLGRTICNHFGVTELADIIALLYHDGFDCARLASLSAALAGARSDEAPGWERIEEIAGEKLAGLAYPLCEFAGEVPGRVFGSGSVLTKNVRVRRSLQRGLSKQLGREVEIEHPELDAPAGAALLALKETRHGVSPGVVRRLGESRR